VVHSGRALGVYESIANTQWSELVYSSGLMSDGKAGESSNQGASSSNNTTARPVGTLRDAATQPASRAIGNVLNRRPTEGAGSSRGRMMFMPNKVIRRKAEE
jgi:hypothetical protein